MIPMTLRAYNVTVGILLVLALVFIAWLLLALHRPTAPMSTNLSATVMKTYPTEWNYRQGRNECGPYSAAAAIRALNGIDVNAATIAAQTPWRLSNGYTVPWGVARVLQKQGLTTKEYTVAKMTDAEKISALQTQLAEGNVAILLGEIHGVQHFITVLGYDIPSTSFLVYDPLQDPADDHMTADMNGELPGNVTMSYDELLTFWNADGIKMFFKGYLLAMSK